MLAKTHSFIFGEFVCSLTEKGVNGQIYGGGGRSKKSGTRRETKNTQKKTVLPPKPKRGLVPVPSL
jgi:hypothetical protein